MTHSTLPLLLVAGAGMHAAEQMALAALPLTAVLVLHADPAVTGALVAAQGAAWLVASIPGGLWIDRYGADRLIRLAPLLAIGGLVGAVGASLAGVPWLLGLAAFIAATGTVLYVLSTNALVPLLVERVAFTRVNARLELTRALATLPAPVLVALLAQHWTPTLGYVAALAGAVIGFAAISAVVRHVPAHRAPAPTPLLVALRDGARFVLDQPLLRGIFACAVFWNFAFFALLAVYVPFALNIAHFNAAQSGYGLSAYGAGLLAGALFAPRLVAKLEPRLTLVFGPLSSAVAALLIALAGMLPVLALPLLGFFFIGFGPMLWLICQTTVRQLVTPKELLGRVGATIQVAIYGVRPLGALTGGMVGHALGLEAALGVVVMGFTLSTAAALLSDLVRLRTLPEAAPA